MNRCQCKTGFFALRDCEWNAITQCAVCRRMVCSPHTAPDSVPEQCRDCWARRQQDAEPPAERNDRSTRYDDDWAYSYRHQYYSSGYAPVHWGSRRHDYYDSYDARSFVAGDQDFEGDDDPQSGFGDS
jgi:hypothetical protein